VVCGTWPSRSSISVGSGLRATAKPTVFPAAHPCPWTSLTVHSCTAHHRTSLTTHTLRRPLYLGRRRIRERATQIENTASAMVTVPAIVTTENTNANSVSLLPTSCYLLSDALFLRFYMGSSAGVHTTCSRNGFGY